MDLIIICVFVALLVFGLGFITEGKTWNNGKCPKCLTKWKNFDMDSQGGRGYKCDCDNTIWISYPFIDAKE